MNYSYNKPLRFSILCWVVLVMPAIHNCGYAQDVAEKHPTYLNVAFTQAETTNQLDAMLTARIKGVRGRKRIENEEIMFYAVSDTAEILLGRANTNMDGVATLEFNKEQKGEANEDGEFTYRAIFDGSEEFKPVSRDISVEEVNMKISFIEIDSIQTIVVSAYQMDAEGNEIPVEEDVAFYVPRQFSMLKIGEAELEDGTGNIQFPVSLPGDSIGNLEIFARIEESRRFGNVEITGVKDWGQPRPPVVIEPRRGLGDTDAPLWMVYTLIVLLSAVWFHYLYIIYVFMVIKRKGKQPDLA